MKPFDLKRALAGDPVVTRDGRKAEVHVFKFIPDRIYGILEESSFPYSWNIDGSWHDGGTKSPEDLFMAPITKVYYMNIYRDTSTSLLTSNMYLSKQTAEHARAKHHDFIRLIQVEVEE